MYIIICSMLLGFLIYSITCNGKQNECPSRFNIFNIGKYKIHLHHWLLSLFGLYLLTLCKHNIDQDTFRFFKGLMLGGIVHGLLVYDDWYKIVY